MKSSPDDRFWLRVQRLRADACWLWTGALDRAGYGRLPFVEWGSRAAHRFSWWLENGEIPPGLCVLHRCDTPACVNPAHLFLGTQKENLADMVRKKRHPTGERHGRAKLNAEDVKEIRRLRDVTGARQKDLALRFGVSRATVGRIIQKRIWR